MRRAILMMLLAVVSSSALAEWVEVSRNDRFTIYANSATIRNKDDMVIVWKLSDYKTAQSLGGHTHLSEKVQFEFDCKEEQNRLLYFSWHSGNMGGGEVIYSGSGTNRWESIPRGSVNEAVLKIACGKR